MAKVTLYLPTPLYERFQPYRDRLHLSTLLQTALTNELNLLESVSEGGAVMSDEAVRALLNDEEDWIGRLRREKANSEEGWFARGVEDGIAWAKASHYPEIRRWGEAQLKDLIPRRQADPVPDVIRDYVGIYHLEADWDYSGFARGWLDGVRRVLRLVRDHS